MNAVKTARPWIRQLLIGLWGFGVWVALVFLFATQFVLVASFSWPEAFRQALFFWGLWGLFLPAAALVAFRFPFDRRQPLLSLRAHLLTCVLVVVVSQTAFRSYIAVPYPASEEERGDSEIRPPVPGPNPPRGFLAMRAGLDILVYCSVALGFQSIVGFRRAQERERRAAELQARLTRSQLQALRMQINPHFLFNTLNAISTLVYVNPRAADEMIGDLSQLLRRSLDSMEVHEIPLARELEFIQSYIGIERKRFGDRLRMEQHVPEELLPALIPALILQPLVENAIRHGIEPQRAPGVVSIRAERDGPRLKLLVRDNGKGVPDEGDRRPKGRGIGLANTQARLRELYGADQAFTFGEDDPRGYRVEILLPFHTEPLPSTPTPPANPS